jgi:branched-chain amino acid transport system ATP-binding protein
MPVLEVEGVDSCYGRSLIIHDLSLNVDGGECVALFGRKGAGRSTLLKTIAGIVKPTHGEIRLNGRVISGLEPQAVTEAGLAYVSEDRRMFRELTVTENLEIGQIAARPNERGWSVSSVFDLFPELARVMNQQAGGLAADVKGLLALGHALLRQPCALLLDEPTQDLTPASIARLGAVIRQLKSAGLAILISESDLSFTGHEADRAYLIEKGAIRWHGAAADLGSDDKIRED